MQHVSRLTDKINNQATSMNSPQSLDAGRIQRLFALMQANYGSRWVDQTGTGNALKLSAQVWGEKLAGLSDDEIKVGLANLPEDFPPTPKKFRTLCVNAVKGLGHNTAAYKPFDKSKAIEYKGDRNLAKSSLAKAKEILGATA